MATKNTATSAKQFTTEAAKEALRAAGLKGLEVTDRAIDETAALHTKVRGQAFQLMAQQFEMQSTLLGFMAENQKALFEMMKAQSESAHEVAFTGLRDASAQTRQALGLN